MFYCIQDKLGCKFKPKSGKFNMNGDLLRKVHPKLKRFQIDHKCVQIMNFDLNFETSHWQ